MSKKLIEGAVIAVAGAAIAKPVAAVAVCAISLTGVIGGFIYQNDDKGKKINFEKVKNQLYTEKFRMMQEWYDSQIDKYKSLYEAEKRKNDFEPNN